MKWRRRTKKKIIAIVTLSMVSLILSLVSLSLYAYTTYKYIRVRDCVIIDLKTLAESIRQQESDICILKDNTDLNYVNLQRTKIEINRNLLSLLQKIEELETRSHRNILPPRFDTL